MANKSDNDNDDTNMDAERIGPMEVGYVFFTLPFIVFCIVLVGMVVASYF